jgi:hypothetical protein
MVNIFYLIDGNTLNDSRLFHELAYLYHYTATSYAILCQFHIPLKQQLWQTNRSILYVIELECVKLSHFSDAQAENAKNSEQQIVKTQESRKPEYHEAEPNL